LQASHHSPSAAYSYSTGEYRRFREETYYKLLIKAHQRLRLG
jgi:hypothetical protein